MLGLTLLAVPIGYAVLTGYLLYKIQPFPITLLPNDLVDGTASTRAARLAA